VQANGKKTEEMMNISDSHCYLWNKSDNFIKDGYFASHRRVRKHVIISDSHCYWWNKSDNFIKDGYFIWCTNMHLIRVNCWVIGFYKHVMLNSTIAFSVYTWSIGLILEYFMSIFSYMWIIMFIYYIYRVKKLGP
jgi:hypothetical protein